MFNLIMSKYPHLFITSGGHNRKERSLWAASPSKNKNAYAAEIVSRFMYRAGRRDAIHAEVNLEVNLFTLPCPT